MKTFAIVILASAATLATAQKPRHTVGQMLWHHDQEIILAKTKAIVEAHDTGEAGYRVASCSARIAEIDATVMQMEIDSMRDGNPPDSGEVSSHISEMLDRRDKVLADCDWK